MLVIQNVLTSPLSLICFVDIQLACNYSHLPIKEISITTKKQGYLSHKSSNVPIKNTHKY